MPGDGSEDSASAVTFGGAGASSGSGACGCGQPLPWTLSLPALNNTRMAGHTVNSPRPMGSEGLQDASLKPIEAKLCIRSPTFPSHLFSKPLPFFPRVPTLPFPWGVFRAGGQGESKLLPECKLQAAVMPGADIQSYRALTGPFGRSPLPSYNPRGSRQPVSTSMMETHLAEVRGSHENFSITVTSDA